MTQDLPILFYKLSTTMITYMNKELKQYNLTFQQYLILEFLSQQSQEIIGKDICQYLGLSHPTVVGLISRMVTSDLLIVRTSTIDRRQSAVCISKHGLIVADKAKRTIDYLTQDIQNILSKEDAKALMSMLIKLNNHLFEEGD